MKDSVGIESFDEKVNSQSEPEKGEEERQLIREVRRRFLERKCAGKKLHHETKDQVSRMHIMIIGHVQDI